MINTKYQPPTIMDMLPILFSVFTSTGSLCSFKRQAQGAESVPGDFFKFTAENIEALQLRKKEVFTCYFPSPYVKGRRKSYIRGDTATPT